MKKLLIVILLISSISYSFYSFSSDKGNKEKIEEVCLFIPFKTYQEFLKEQKNTGKEVQDYYQAYGQWYSQWLKNNENLAYQEYLKKPHPAKQEFEKHLPEGLRKDIGNIVQGYLYVDFKQWQENNEKLLDYTKKGNIKSIQELLRSGDVDINARDQDHGASTALMWAVIFGNKELVELLLEKGANINAQDRNGSTALMCATQFGNKGLVELLLEKGANINAQDRNGSTALMIAIRSRHKDMVKLLLEKGANKDIINNDGSTALMITRNKDIIEILNKNVLA